MTKAIGEIKEIKGDFFVKRVKGETEKVVHGDKVYDGDTLYGSKDNTLENAILVGLILIGREVIIMADESQRFDEIMLSVAADESIAQTTPLSVALLHDAIETRAGMERDQLDQDETHAQSAQPESTGVETAIFMEHDDQETDIKASASDPVTIPDDDSLSIHDAQEITGIIDLGPALDDTMLAPSLAASAESEKSVHTEILQTAIENAQHGEDAEADKVTSSDAEDTVLGNGFDVLLTSNTYAIDYDDISSAVREVQLANNDGTQTIKTLSIEDVLDITPSDDHTLRINGDSEDIVDLSQQNSEDGSLTQWTKATESLICDDGNIYDIYTGISGTDTITLQIDQNITVTDF